MRWFAANLTVIFWSFIFGMIIDYIGSALAAGIISAPRFLAIGYTEAVIISAVVAVIAVNGVHAFMNAKD